MFKRVINKLRLSVPSWFTGSNVLLGVLSIVFSGKGEFTGASLCILLAAVLDFLDGAVARLLKAESTFGKEFDSLADAITFGAAPALLLFYLGDFSGLGYLKYAPLLLALFAALRLAYFNSGPSQKDAFSGLPSPAAGMFVAGLPLGIEFSRFRILHLLDTDWFIPGISIFLSFAMVMPVKMVSFKSKKSVLQSIPLAVIIAGIIYYFKAAALPFIILSYILWSLILNIAVKIRS